MGTEHRRGVNPVSSPFRRDGKRSHAQGHGPTLLLPLREKVAEQSEVG